MRESIAHPDLLPHVLPQRNEGIFSQTSERETKSDSRPLAPTAAIRPRESSDERLAGADVVGVARAEDRAHGLPPDSHQSLRIRANAAKCRASRSLRLGAERTVPFAAWASFENPSSGVSAFDQPLGPDNGSEGLAPGDA